MGIQWSVDLTEEVNCWNMLMKLKDFQTQIRQQIDIDDMQFGFVKGKGTIDASMPFLL